MPAFGKVSQSRLDTCHDQLQFVMNKAILRVDFSILCGFRGEEEQMAAYRAVPKKSNALWLESPHNYKPSFGVDIAPYPIDWQDHKRFAHLAGIVVGIGLANGIPLTWGGDWDRDGVLSDQKFNDLPHIEITNWRGLR